MRVLPLATLVVCLTSCNPIETERAGFEVFKPASSTQEILTADDQPLGGSDLHVAREIRQQVLRLHALSFAARNIKIIVMDGNVTLRGQVMSTEEKSLIENIAQRLSPGTVSCQLSVIETRATNANSLVAG